MTVNQSQQASPFPRHRDFKKSLSATATAWFRAKGLAVSRKYPYCLESRKQWADNIILPEVTSYIEQQRQSRAAQRLSFALHKFVHHGLSSQAMLFNLVGPLIVRNDMEPLRVAFAATGAPWPSGKVEASLEIEDRRMFNERQAQPTSIDLVIAGEGPPSLYVEAKLVEPEFGGCSTLKKDGDCCGRNPAMSHEKCFLHRIGRTYWPRISQLGFLQSPMTDGPICPLATYYQFFREVVFAIQKGGHFVLLFDQRSPVFYRPDHDGDQGLMPFLLTFVPPQHRHRIHAVTIQAVAETIRQSGRHGDWISIFNAKYGLSAT